MIDIEKVLKKRIVFLNGATGTNLLDKGLEPGESPSILNLRNPQAVYEIHKAYVNAGADIILTNTFSANPFNIQRSRLEDVITEGIKLAERAAGKRAVVLGNVGPLGELIRPYGELDFDEALKIFQRIYTIFSRAGIKKFLIETFTSIIEAKAAFLAARTCSQDIYVCLSLQGNGRTIMGDIPETIAITFERLGAKGIGINCTEPEVAIKAVAKMAKVTNRPLIIKPNAGKVKIVGTKIHHTLSDAVMARYFKKFVNAGACIIGGCCGTSPTYIKRIAQNRKIRLQQKVPEHFFLASPSKVIRVDDNATIVVGERLNPAGCKKVRRRLEKRDYKVYAEEAKTQEQAGADVLDVNAFMVEVNEKTALKKAVHEVLKNSQLPLFIDTQNLDAALAVLSFYPGVGVYNSIAARRKELVTWLPLVKKYGFKAVISLVGKKIPRSVGERLANVNQTLQVAAQIGFSKEDLIFDPLVFSAATEQEQINQTLETVALLHKRGLKTVLGISNVSFGLPNRSHLNSALATAAIKSGVTFLISNPLDDTVMTSIKAAKTLFKGEISYLHEYVHIVVEKKSVSKKGLNEAIMYGDERASVEFAQALLESGTPAQKVLDDYIAKALKCVGDYYENGTFFIPDLLKAAEASKAVLAVLKDYLPKKQKKGTIVLATVKGDIHDIGKNIAAMIFESAGYLVIDLGKDVPVRKIIRAIRQHKPDALGLSALLTTTMCEMENVVKRLSEEKINIKVIIGGPNVTARYARKIGAYGAARNVLQGLRLLQKIR